MKQKILAVLLLVTSISPVFADWVLLDSGQKNGISSYYTDPTTARRSGDYVKMWILLDYEQPQPNNFDQGTSYLSLRGHVEYNCKNQTHRALIRSLHSDHMGRGVVLKSIETVGKWTPSNSGDSGLSAWKVACSR